MLCQPAAATWIQLIMFPSASTTLALRPASPTASIGPALIPRPESSATSWSRSVTEMVTTVLPARPGSSMTYSQPFPATRHITSLLLGTMSGARPKRSSYQSIATCKFATGTQAKRTSIVTPQASHAEFLIRSIARPHPATGRTSARDSRPGSGAGASPNARPHIPAVPAGWTAPRRRSVFLRSSSAARRNGRGVLDEDLLVSAPAPVGDFGDERDGECEYARRQS